MIKKSNMKKMTSVMLAAVMLAAGTVGITVNTYAEDEMSIVYGINSDIDDFNPMTNQMTTYVSTFVFNVYEPLFHLNGNMEYEMDLASEVNQIDDVTYEIILREGVKFHNGQDFTAKDVINTIEYIKNEENGAWRVSQYTTVDSMEADGDYKLTIKLTDPTPAFMDNLAYTPIFCSEDDPATDLVAAANGTGAYKFVSWTPNDQIVMEKFEEYWDSEAVSVDNLTFKPYPDYSIGIINMQSGTLDGLNMITVDNASTIEATEGLSTVAAATSNTMDLFEIGRHNCEAFSDPAVIEAMLLAFDVESINAAVYQGMGEVMTSCYPSGAKYHTDVLGNEYDLEKAKEVLASSGYPDGFEFTCTLLSGAGAGEMAAVIWQASLAQIGITMNIQIEEMSVWLDSYLGRTYDMIWNSYGMVGSDPATFNSIILEQLYDYQLSDLTELQELIQTGKSTMDEGVREEIYGKIQEIVAEYGPVYPYIAAPLICAVRDNVSGLEINGMGHIFFKDVVLN